MDPLSLTLLGWLEKLWWLLKWPFNWIRSHYNKTPLGQIAVPKATLVLARSQRSNSCWWHMGARDGVAVMQIAGEFHATNIFDYAVKTVGVRMKKPNLGGVIMVKSIGRGRAGTVSTNHVIPHGGMTTVHFDFWADPPFKKVGEPFDADIIVVDQFNNEHLVKNVRFTYAP